MQRISVVIPTYNYASFIGQAIESVLSQTRLPDEIIVVDDGSTDETEMVVARFGNSVRYIKKANGGVCSARNTGIESSTGNFIAFFDADDICHPTRFEKQLAKFAEDSAIGLVHCGIREIDGIGNIIRVNLDGKEGWVAEEMLLLKPVVVGPGGTIIVRREAVSAVGAFNERLEIYEDWEFCYRIANKYKIGFVSEALVDYRLHGHNSHLNLEKMEKSLEIAFAQAFDAGGETKRRLRRTSYGNFYKMLAGSYFQQRNYPKFIKNSLKSLWMNPSNARHYLTSSLRRLLKS